MAMTANVLKAAGYRISAQVKDEQVDKAYNEVWAAYIEPLVAITPGAPHPQVVGQAAQQLCWILLCRRDTVVTRAGARDKLAPSLSEDANVRQADLEEADRRLRLLQTLNNATQGNISQIVNDIAHIYYRNEFLGL